MFIIFDTETTGLPRDYFAPYSSSDNWPRLVQLAWQIHDNNGNLIEAKNYIIKPEGFEIPYETIKVHGISTERAIKFGHNLLEVLLEFNQKLETYNFIVGHNISFDEKIIGAEMYRKEISTEFLEKISQIDTKNLSTEYCAIPGKGKGFKWPSLSELHLKLFNENFDEAHNAAADVEATARCFLELVRIGVIEKSVLKWTNKDLENFRNNNQNRVEAIGLETKAYDDSELLIESSDEKIDSVSNNITDIDFTHLHVHTQFSILDGLTNIKKLAAKAKKDGMKAVAITDHGNMYGVKEFHQTLIEEGLKPIIGSEVYMAYRSHLDKERQDSSSYHLVLLAKNETGYRNLIKLSSIGFIDGFYYKPRIDKDLLKEYSEGIIALSACLGGEIPQKIMKSSVEAAENVALEYKEIFGDDFYIELQRHKTNIPDMNSEVYKDQVFVNEKLIEIAKKNNIKYVATNDVHFLNQDDYLAHDRLICLNTGKDIDDEKRIRYTGQEWFKTRDEMAEIFADIPESLLTTQEISDKIETYELDRKAIMPDFKMPELFKNYNEYLRHISYEGAKERWGEELSEEITSRLDFELETIAKMDFPSYFLIVWDFLKAAREIGVIVGPGRGSAAGSAVAYCLKITDIDPLKYNLLFERFLNPDRVSMPDIDIDFDDDGRDKILKWVKEKYGARRVAHIITFGTMAAKLSIRDVARVQKLHLSEADRLAKLVPEKPGSTLKDAYKEVPELKNELTKGSDEIRSVLEYAEKMEGSVRNTGTHACGVIIGKDDLDKYLPIATVKDSMLDYSTQFDGKYVESIGLLKMDFLGLKTLTIIKESLENIKLSKGIEVDISKVSLEDKETFELYARGETTALFQFESPGMQKSLKELKPTHFEDLIAMNALYRPGPMEYIPNFIARKNGYEKIIYDLPEQEEILKDTYGITVYQEQVMLLSRKLAGFSKGDSDSLRKAMGKKIKSMMDDLKTKFFEGCKKNGYDIKTVEKIWSDWEDFAKYAFNKSHATCYSYVSFQTAYLKAHYPAEFMAAVLSHNLKDIKKLTFYLNEVNRMGIKVLGPDVNESFSNFTVNKDGNLRYGMEGVKGVGEAAVKEIIRERKENGPFKSIFDFVKRLNLRTVNKKSIEALANTGGFDNLDSDIHRAQFFYKKSDDDSMFLEKILHHGQKYQENKNNAQVSLFGDADESTIQEPEFPKCDKWSATKILKIEKSLIGFYLSGHPLDNYKVEFNSFIKNDISSLSKLTEENKRVSVNFGGIVTEASHRKTKKDKPFASFKIEDMSGEINLFLFGENYLKYGHLLKEEMALYIDAQITKSFKNENESELKITNISLIEDLFEKKAPELILLLKATKINDAFIESFKDFISNSSGKSVLKIKLKHEKHGTFDFKSQYLIDIKTVLSKINQFPDVKFKLN